MHVSVDLILKAGNPDVSCEKTEKFIGIIPCAYLHNYEEKYLDELNDDIYKMWYEKAPFFIKNQVMDLRKFIKKFISKKIN